MHVEKSPGFVVFWLSGTVPWYGSRTQNETTAANLPTEVSATREPLGCAARANHSNCMQSHLLRVAAAATQLQRIHNMMTLDAPASGPACKHKGQEAAKHCTEGVQVQTRDGVDVSDDQRAIVTFFRRRVALQRSRQATPTIQIFAEVLSCHLDRASGCKSATRAACFCGSIH